MVLQESPDLWEGIIPQAWVSVRDTQRSPMTEDLTRGGDHETRVMSSFSAALCGSLTGHDDTRTPRAWRRGCTSPHGPCA